MFLYTKARREPNEHSVMAPKNTTKTLARELTILASKTLADLEAGQRGIVLGFDNAEEPIKRRLTAFGIIRGTEIMVDRTAPMGNPRTYNLRGYLLSPPQ